MGSYRKSQKNTSKNLVYELYQKLLVILQNKVMSGLHELIISDYIFL